MNGDEYVSPSVPVLLQILSGAQTADTLLPSGSVYALPANKTIELSIPGGAVGGPVRSSTRLPQFPVIYSIYFSIHSICTVLVHTILIQNI